MISITQILYFPERIQMILPAQAGGRMIDLSIVLGSAAKFSRLVSS